MTTVRRIFDKHGTSSQGIASSRTRIAGKFDREHRDGAFTVLSLARVFQGPLQEFRPVPFWFWNGDPTTKRRLKQQIDALQAQGVGGVMPMPLYGLDLEFGKDSWHRMIRYAAGICAERKLPLWLYDEFHCPSGTCAGRVIRDHPEFQRTALVFHSFPVARGRKLDVRLRHSSERYPDPEEGREIFADSPPRVYIETRRACTAADDFSLAHVRSGDDQERRSYRLEWRNRMGVDATVHLFTLVKGNCTLPSSYGARWSLHQPGYLDVLNPRAVAAFLGYTFDAYDREVGGYYGNTIRGMFTDEPGMAYGVFNGGTARLLSYTPTLFAQFQAAYGYDLEERLPELAADVGEYRRTRVDYWRLVTRLFSEHFNRQYAGWCARRGLIFTGHYMAEEWLNGSAMMNGDLHSAARHMHMPGLDLLRTDTPYTPVNPAVKCEQSSCIVPDRQAVMNVTAKAVVSAARAAGARRVLCEANGVPKWAVTLQDLKTMADWLCGMGVNFINDNGIPYSLKGIRIIAGRGFSAPWWPHYKRYADYAARLSAVMSAGRAETELAVLYPSTATWSQLNRHTLTFSRETTRASAPDLSAMQSMLIAVTNGLIREHREYDYLYEDCLREAKISRGILLAGACRYRVVLLPAAPTLDEECHAALNSFVRRGGQLVLLGRTPEWIVGRRGVRRLPAGAWKQRGVYLLPGAERDSALSSLTALLDRLLPKPVSIGAEHPELIQTALRRLDDAHLLFLVNHGRRGGPVDVTCPWPGNYEIWNLETGAIAPALDAAPTAGGRRIRLMLDPGESCLLVARHGRAERKTRIIGARPPAPETLRGMKLNGAWDFIPESDNLLLLEPAVAFDFNDTGLRRGWPKDRGGADWRPVVDGSASLALSPDVMAAYWLRAEVSLGEMPRRLRLFHDGEAVCRVFVNGREARRVADAALWDEENLCFDVRPLMRRGRNLIVLRVAPSPYLTRDIFRESLKADYPFPAVLAGDFIVGGRKSVRHLERWLSPCPIRPASWHSQGFPHYAGKGTYRTEFQIARDDAAARRVWLDLGVLRDVAEIKVNGKTAAVRPWTPYRAEITRELRAGKNRLQITLANTFGNLLRRHYCGWDRKGDYPAGLIGGVTIVSGIQGA